MKKIFLMAYVRKNLGDDLFIKMLAETYSDCIFFMNVNTDEYIDNLKNISNLEISVVNNLKEELYNLNVLKYNAFVYIGGSIFIEPQNGSLYYNNFNEFIDKCKQNGVPFYYISCNFGPYSSKNYFDYSRKIFESCTDICFRDKYSYNLFSDISSVRYAPDFIFNYKANSTKVLNDSIGISVIDLSIRKNLNIKNEDYINFLTSNIKNYLNDNKQVYLFSFCEYEGDEKTINSVLERFPDEKNIHAVKYDGDLDKFLNLYSQMEYAICTRFHSFVLSSVFKQKIYVVSYSSKIDNVLEDLNLGLPIVKLNSVDCSTILSLENFRKPNEKSLNSAIELAFGQQASFDKFISFQ